jgi:TonB family protein
MSAELWSELVQACLASGMASLLILLIRKPLRQLVGTQLAYTAWMLVPMAVVAMLVPAPAKKFFSLAQMPSGIGLSGVVPYAMAATSLPDPRLILLAIWSLGMLITLIVFARRQSEFNRRVKRCSDSQLNQVIGHGPAVVGLLRPRIVLPSDFQQRYTADEQRLVLAHEQIHLQRGDIYAQSVAAVLRCLFWFNPLVHYAAARFRFDQELACDAAVLERFPNSRRSYGGAMLKAQLADFGLPVGCHWHSSHPLKERIAMLKNPLPGAQRRTFGLLLVSVLVTTGAVSAWAAQPEASSVGAITTESASDAPADVIFVPTDSATLPAPPYPKDALSKGQSGSVVLQLLVGVDGKVAEVKVVSSEPAGLFDRVAIDAASKWQLNPAVDAKGNKVESWVQVPLTFSADGDGKHVGSR